MRSWKLSTGEAWLFLRSPNSCTLNASTHKGTKAMTRNVLLKLLGGSNSSHAFAASSEFLAAVSWGGHSRRAYPPDMKFIEVQMKLRWWNANYVGTHFGGSLFAMTDAFYMLMVMANLGSGYIVWDKAASIRYRKPGKGTVRAEFRLADAQLDEIRQKLETLPNMSLRLKSM